MLAVVGVLALAVVAGGVALWPRGEVARPAAAGQQDPTRVLPATLTRLQDIRCEQPDPTAPNATCIKVEAQLADGRRVSFETTDPTGDTFRVGQRVKLAELEQEGQATYYNIRDFERTRPMLVLVALFVVAVVAFGGWQGIRSLIGLAVSFAVIIGFIVPAILRGHSPVPVALVGAMAIMLASLYLSHGVGRKTTAAVIGTALALGLTAALTAGFVAATSLTGLASEDAQNASFQVGGLSLRGLLLAAIIIGGLGVLDDVTVSQASLVFQLRRADPTAGFGELVRGALTVGRDHIAATVNTLFLAYAGASLPLLVLFSTGGAGFGEVATAEVAAVEIVRTLCGSVGLIAAVPLTTLLAAALASHEAEAVQEPARGGTGASGRPDRRSPALLARARPGLRRRRGAVRARPCAPPTGAVACDRGRQRLGPAGGAAGRRSPSHHRPEATGGHRPRRPLVSKGDGRWNGLPRPARSGPARPAATRWAVLHRSPRVARGRSGPGRPEHGGPRRRAARHLPPGPWGARSPAGRPRPGRPGRSHPGSAPLPGPRRPLRSAHGAAGGISH